MGEFHARLRLHWPSHGERREAGLDRRPIDRRQRPDQLTAGLRRARRGPHHLRALRNIEQDAQAFERVVGAVAAGDGKGDLTGARPGLADFYLTNMICRASPTMQRCSAELVQGEQFAEAAE